MLINACFVLETKLVPNTKFGKCGDFLTHVKKCLAYHRHNDCWLSMNVMDPEPANIRERKEGREGSRERGRGLQARHTAISGSSGPHLFAPSRSREEMFTWEPPTVAGVPYFRRKPCAAPSVRGPPPPSTHPKGMCAKCPGSSTAQRTEMGPVVTCGWTS